MNKKYIMLNKAGHYLSYGQCLSHGVATTHSYSWTDELNRASVFTDTQLKSIENIKWKSGSPHKEIVVALPVIETRTIEIIIE